MIWGDGWIFHVPLVGTVQIGSSPNWTLLSLKRSMSLSAFPTKIGSNFQPPIIFVMMDHYYLPSFMLLSNPLSIIGIQ